ncbi:2-C-methyl-D-erythritol 2,4-cyclodiphosphate synthase [hydrothermal vent metagenome]|uniref:2-C-methyl-D-erythritol 2,4-cyclodiphosphate synthase n=1 Tax=hydrothermal vent metagenome TaxID=652676 RepID=A0A3B0YVN0_9ZZZZ
MRIGHGYDAHRFAEDGTLVLGGVNIEHPVGLLAHSDGDVLLHAVCDALLGALALGDIGRHFPDTAAKFENIDSRVLLRHVVQQAHEKKYVIGNLDVTVIAQQPKLKSYIGKMVQALAEDLHVDITQVNVKATTTEGMGFVGRCEGIAAHAVVMLIVQP